MNRYRVTVGRINEAPRIDREVMADSSFAAVESFEDLREEGERTVARPVMDRGDVTVTGDYDADILAHFRRQGIL